MKLEGQLSNLCSSVEGAQYAISFLKQHIADKINILYKNGLCFGLAIKYNQDQLFEALLNYYKETRLDREQDQETYRKSLSDLQDCLCYLAKNDNPTIEIRDLMREYISFDAMLDLRDIKTNTSRVCLEVPCLKDIDDVDDIEDMGQGFVELVLGQLRDIKHSLDNKTNPLHMMHQAQQKAINKAIDLMESQYDLEARIYEADEDTLSGGLSEEEIENEQELGEQDFEGQDLGDQGLGRLGIEQKITKSKVMHNLHKSNSAPDILPYFQEKATQEKAAPQLLHSSSESLLSALDSGAWDVGAAGALVAAGVAHSNAAHETTNHETTNLGSNGVDPTLDF